MVAAENRAATDAVGRAWKAVGVALWHGAHAREPREQLYQMEAVETARVRNLEAARQVVALLTRTLEGGTRVDPTPQLHTVRALLLEPTGGTGALGAELMG